jgi:pimeloyl-ACP methyl ester carboxylesterase
LASLAAFLIVLGLLQLIAVYFGLRGASLTGPLSGPGVLLGIVIFMAGVWLAVDEPVWQLVLFGLVALVPAIAILLLAGIILNLGWNPTRNLQDKVAEEGYVMTDVMVPVRLAHIEQNADAPDYLMPATYMHPELKEPIDATAKTPVVLLICGAGDTRLTFKWRILREFFQQQIAVLTIDPPGQGEFNQVQMTADNALAAAGAALTWIREQPGVDRIGICGISFGGNQAAALAAEDMHVTALALISTPVTLAPLTPLVYRHETLSLFVFPKNWLVLRDGSIVTLYKEWKKLGRAWYGDSLYKMVDCLDVLGAVRKYGERPLLVVQGSRDRAVPAYNATKILQAITTTPELKLIRQANHVTPILLNEGSTDVAKWFKRKLSGD